MVNETTLKILPDPDLHYGVRPEDHENYIQKAPQRPRKARRAEEMQKTTLDTSDLIRSLLDFEFEIKITGEKTSEGDGRTAADIERERALAGDK